MVDDAHESKIQPAKSGKRARTWEHLAGRRQRPSEYEIVSTNLTWRNINPESPFELNPNIPMSRWYLRYCNGSPLKHDNWEDFRDPDRLVYRTYNVMQDTEEAYVDGLLDEHDRLGHDTKLSERWLSTLARMYAPGRYLMHTVQMASAYLVHMAPASTITLCAAFQMGDSLRWVSRIAYRTRELAKHHPDEGFGKNERKFWEDDPVWQGFRELSEKVLVAYDWAETFVALNAVARPAIDEVFIRQLGTSAQANGDMLLKMLSDAQMRDSERSRRWTAELIRFALQKDGNRQVLDQWMRKWVPLSDKAIEAFCDGLPQAAQAAESAKRGARDFRETLGL